MDSAPHPKPPDSEKPRISWKDLVGAFSDPAIIIGEDDRIHAANPACVGTDGSGFPEIIGRKCHEASHHSSVTCDKNGESCPLLEAREGNTHSRAIHIHHTLGGRLFASVEVFAVPVPEGETPLCLERLNPSTIAHPDPDQVHPGAAETAGNDLPGPSNALGISLRILYRKLASLRDSKGGRVRGGFFGKIVADDPVLTSWRRNA